MIHGRNDTLAPVSEARAFVAALRERSGSTVTYAEIPGAQHAFDVFSSIRSQHTIGAVQRWLQWHLATAKQAGDHRGRAQGSSPPTRTSPDS